MIHRGEVLSRIVTLYNVNVTRLAIRVGYNRTTYYSHIKKENLRFEVLAAYGRAIPYDFTKDIPEMSAYVLENDQEIKEFEAMKADRDKWKDKYYGLLEKYNTLLEEKK